MALVGWVTLSDDWDMPGLREALSGNAGRWGWFLRRGARRTPRRNSAKEIKTERKLKTQQQTSEKEKEKP